MGTRGGNEGTCWHGDMGTRGETPFRVAGGGLRWRVAGCAKGRAGHPWPAAAEQGCSALPNAEMHLRVFGYGCGPLTWTECICKKKVFY